MDRPDIEAVFGLPLPDMSDAGLDSEALRQARILALAFLRMRESLWLNLSNGALDTEVWDSYRAVLVTALEHSELLRTIWDFYSPGFAPGFQNEINGQLR